MHLFGCRLVLDEFDHPVAIDNIARRGAKVLAHPERVLVGQRHHEIAIPRLEIAHEVFQPVNKALAVSLGGTFQRLGVGAEEIRRAEHIDNLPREEIEPLAVVILKPVDIHHRLMHRIGVHQVLLLEKVEVGVAVPEGTGKALVLGAGIIGCFELAFRQLLLRLEIMLQRLAPIAHLMFEDLGRVLHHLGQIARGCLEVEILPRPFERGARELLAPERRHEAGVQLFEPGHVGFKLSKVGRVIFIHI